MTSDTTTTRPLTIAARIRRLLAVFSLVLALVVISAFIPDGASAMPRSERAANRMCAAAGGRMHYEFNGEGNNDYDMTCTLPSGARFFCLPYGSDVLCY